MHYMLEKFFRQLAYATAQTLGSSKAFFVALVLVIGWLASGRYYGYSDTWQLYINTSTTIITFLMVILIQHTQNHDAKAFHLKLDELIRAVRSARTSLVNLEEMSDEELDKLRKEFDDIRDHAIKKDQRS
jgi:low affinity Fe/Cu permease